MHLRPLHGVDEFGDEGLDGVEQVAEGRGDFGFGSLQVRNDGLDGGGGVLLESGSDVLK